MLEVLTRRYYGNKGLTGVRTREVAGCTFVVAETRRTRRVVSAAVSSTRWAARCAGSRSWRAARTPSTPTSTSTWENQPEDFDAMAAALRRSSARTRCRAQVRRLTTTVAGRGGAVMHHHFTFRPSAPGWPRSG